MRFGVREICNVVFRAKAAQKVGNKIFYKNEPVIYFDSLKTSSLEGQATTVYAQGGRGNSRLVAWEGERTVTFTMEDALISPVGFMILSGAGLIEAGNGEQIITHVTEQTDLVSVNSEKSEIKIYLSQQPYLPTDNNTYIGPSGSGQDAVAGSTITTSLANTEDYIYVMLMKDGEIVSEPYIPIEVNTIFNEYAAPSQNASSLQTASVNRYEIVLKATEASPNLSDDTARKNDFSAWVEGDRKNVVFVDYYTPKTTGAYQIDITPDKFGGNYYVEADTLFRDEKTGIDMPATFVIPNAKVQSNFTFTMASSGDPSTFTFTLDAFPDYTRWNKKQKVLASIQVIDTAETLVNYERLGTPHDNAQTSWATSDQKKYFDLDGKNTGIGNV